MFIQEKIWYVVCVKRGRYWLTSKHSLLFLDCIRSIYRPACMIRYTLHFIYKNDYWCLEVIFSCTRSHCWDHNDFYSNIFVLVIIGVFLWLLAFQWNFPSYKFVIEKLNQCVLVEICLIFWIWNTTLSQSKPWFSIQVFLQLLLIVISIFSV